MDGLPVLPGCSVIIDRQDGSRSVDDCARLKIIVTGRSYQRQIQGEAPVRAVHANPIGRTSDYWESESGLTRGCDQGQSGQIGSGEHREVDPDAASQGQAELPLTGSRGRPDK